MGQALPVKPDATRGVSGQCEWSGHPVSMRVITRELDQLRSHRVYRTASIWQRSVAAMRAQMTMSS
jgi:hypothetical protein